MAATEQELLTFVHAMFEALNEQRSFSRYREHVQKLNVSAGDHCLYTDPVGAGRRRTVTSICSVADCSDVDVVILARGFMHNVFEVGRYLTPGQDETTCAEGLWILGPGEYMQACFEGVPEGCDLHLYANGSYKQAISFLFGLPAMITAPEEEVPPVAGYLWLAETYDEKIYKIDASDGSIVDSFDAPGNGSMGLTHDGTNLWCADQYLNTIFKIDPSDGTILDSFNSPDPFPHGLAYDGTNLWNCALTDNKLYKLDPSNGDILGSCPTALIEPYGLTYIDGFLWATDPGLNKFWRWNPSTCDILEKFATPGPDPWGVTYDGTNMWCVDQFPGLKIYKLDLDGNILDSFDAPSYEPTGLAWSTQ